MTMIEGRLNQDSAVYTGDLYLVAKKRQFEKLLSPKVERLLESDCITKKIPYIDPSVYFTFFNVGLTRMSQATTDRLKLQCGMAAPSERLVVAPSLAEDLFQDYRMKLYMLSQIHSSSKSDQNYVQIDGAGIVTAKEALSSAIMATGISYIREYEDPEEQKILLLDFAAKARSETLPILFQTCEPIFDSGERVMDVLFQLLGKNKKKYLLPIPKL